MPIPLLCDDSAPTRIFSVRRSVHRILFLSLFATFAAQALDDGGGRESKGIPDPTSTFTPSPTPTPSNTPIPGSYAPALADLPDLRLAVDGAGAIETALTLNDFVVDPDDRNPSTGGPAALSWSKGSVTGFDFLNLGAANELEAVVSPQLTGAEGTAVLEAVDSAGNEIAAPPVRVHTSTLLLGAPLVDERLFLGDEASAVFPYAWGLGLEQEFQIETPSLGESGDLTITVVEGLDSTDFISESAVVTVDSHAKALNPHRKPHTLLGFQSGGLGETVELAASGLTIQAGSAGLVVRAQSHFTDWVYVSVGQRSESGPEDCYTIAVGDLLLGTTENLNGSPTGAATQLAPRTVYGFESLSLNAFLGAPSVASYEAAPLQSLAAQQTSWLVSAVGQDGANLEVPGVGRASLGEIFMTSGPPPADYPGATNGRALCLELDRPDFCGLLLQHKGLDPQRFRPGDVITLAVNLYVDLNYGGGPASDEEINRNVNSPVIALALGTQPFLESVNYNFVCYPFGESLDGVVEGVDQAVNHAAALHGKWTRHEVSFRVPESGVNVSGPAGSGNLAFPNSLTAVILIARADTRLTNHSQFIYMDNISITNLPGALVLAEGGTRVPMVSAGWGFAWPNGSTGGMAVNVGDPVPASISRGQTIHGGFSFNAPNNSPATLLANAGAVAYSKFQENAAAGWLAELGDTDLSFIADGGGDVALGFPILASGNKAMALAPSPALVGNNYPTPNSDRDVPHDGVVRVNTPYLDMRLISDRIVPGLRVEDVSFPGGGIPGNVSGVFGVRFFHRTNAVHVSQNPGLTAVLTNADVNIGIVASRLPNVLTAGNNNTYSGTVWIDDMVSGSFISFNSNQRVVSVSNVNLLSTMAANNPGNQLASVQFTRGGGGIVGPQAIFYDSVGFNAYQSVYGTGAAAQENVDHFPGRYSTAVVFVDEVHLHAVHDHRAFYDADLRLWP